jgi:hypothetical protein
LPFSKVLYLQPELTFIQKGGDKAFLIDNLTIKTNQLELAALVGYKVKTNWLSIFFNPGVFYGRIISKSIDGNPFLNPYKQAYSNWDFGLIFGGGIEFPIGSGKIILEGRYRPSLNNFGRIEDADPNDPIFDSSLKNRGWGLNLGYSIVIRNQ